LSTDPPSSKDKFSSQKILLDSSGYSAPSDASTIPQFAPTEIHPLDSTNPNWINNFKVLAQSRALLAIADLSFQPKIFEQLLSDRVLNSTPPFTAEQTELAISSIFSCSFQQAPSRAASLIYSDSEDSAPLGYEKVLDPRHRSHKAFVRTMLKSREHSPDTSARLQSFLDSPSRPRDSTLHLDSLTSSPSAASSLSQLLSPVEKN
jgi:hypothetical protein